MDKFESQFADLDVQTSYMESTMSDTTAMATPQDQVDSLMQQVADEAGLEIQHGLGEAKVPAKEPTLGEATKEEDSNLAERLRALRVSDNACRMRLGKLADTLIARDMRGVYVSYMSCVVRCLYALYALPMMP